jgi:DNA repair protein RecO (recombination protein O)
VLAGERLLAALYVNELLLRLTPRNDPAPALFDLYARLRGELAAPDSLSWTLRRFERDLLDALGVGLPWDSTAEGEPCEPAGAIAWTRKPGRSRHAAARGQHLRRSAARARRRPPAGRGRHWRSLRRGLRRVLQSHLGSTPLRSWGLLEELSKVRPRDQR